ncbi:DUF1501 domain-containing protein [Fulvivirga sediminis]|uniref:DUF1501 domain-containing protein n=1 Tax=Fulvivirga sediminis TaxID=2803949 RepID=A0A937FAL0_9BACT|nr:DUF1501 domain-containing protein [Fulvivirga sediminis]MBL3657345.1 DUF1501 domain-containing protein [Fulvivirga sediminis]
MKRRNFLKSVPLAAGGAFAINSIPMHILAKENRILRAAELDDNDRVLVIIQLHGGNDGLNSVIPVNQYDLYYNLRPNIAIPAKNSARRYIPLDSTFSDESKLVGLHPDMTGVKSMYDTGKINIVQGVSYPKNNGSHFRGRDIWLMGAGFDRYEDSGWVGRYLSKQYAPEKYPDDFPNANMLDPLAIELGSDVSLLFHQKGNIPTSVSLPNNPEAFVEVLNGLVGFDDVELDPRGLPPAYLKDSPYYKEMEWILGLEDKTEQYAERLLNVYNNAPATSVPYPETYPFSAPKSYQRNGLSGQLQVVSRLISGGAKTKVYMVKIGGFDTHADQVESHDATMGLHAALMYHISSAMQAFQADLRARGIEDRVVTMTISEFGRRIKSNGSYGTDHGKGGPMFLFGKYVKGGVTGHNMDLTGSPSNVDMQYDYRQIYANLLHDWLKVPKDQLGGLNDGIVMGSNTDTNFYDGPKEDGDGFYKPLNLIDETITGTEGFFNERFSLRNAYPNPTKGQTTMSFFINSEAMVNLKIMDIKGKTVKTVIQEKKSPGEHQVQVNLADLEPGMYFYKIEAGLLQETKKIIVQ